MAALESLPLSFFRLSYSSNPPSIIPHPRSNLSLPLFTTKHPTKLSYPHHHLSISGKFQLSSSSAEASAVQDEVLVEQTEKQLEKESGQNRVFVLNLPWSYSVDDLKNLFGECGTVKDAEIITRKKDGKSRGYAFVTMASAEEALSAIEKYDSHELMGRIIRVEFAKDIKKSSPPPSTTGEKRYKLYVSNLAWRVRSNHLRDLFAAEINPVSTRVIFESQGSRSAGYGFVTFASKEEAESAISKFNGKELLGREITLRFSEVNEDKTETAEENASIEQPVES